MIRARDIIEAYLTRLPLLHKRGSFEVFENPSFKELKSADSTGLGVRFTADASTKKVYAWDADAVIHDLVHSDLGIKGKGKPVSYGWSNLLTGLAEQQGSKYVMVVSDMLRDIKLLASTPGALEMFSNDWLWVDRYILITPFLRDVGKKLEQE
jgi:hypothetical protein